MKRPRAFGSWFGAWLGAVVAAALALGPVVWRRSPTAGDLLDRHLGPSRRYPLGTDALGRDHLARVLHGGRTSLLVAVVVVAATVVIAVTVGVTAGYLGGVVDAVLMRLTDVLLAVPSLLLAIAVVAMLGPGLRNAMAALVAILWCPMARVIRAEVLSLKASGFVGAAVAVGARRRHVARHHLVPHLSPTVIVLATLDLGVVLLALAGLSYLGLGNPPPAPEWGRMLLDARPHLQRYPLEVVVPGVAISLTTLAVALIGDPARPALPRRHHPVTF